MDGLETLVAPTHHAFLLTESAAAAHFNVLSFDTCLFKPSSTSSFATNHLLGSVTSGAQSAAAHYQFHHHPSSGNNHHHHTTTGGPTSGQSAAAGNTSNSSSSSSNSNSSNNTASAVTGTNISSGTVHPITLGAPQADSGPSSRVANSHGPTITILDNGNSGLAQSKSINDITAGGSTETPQGDLNTPVTTANDLPSFFGPSTVVVEPPPITGELVP